MANLKAANALYLGSTALSKAYYGSTQVWPVGGAPFDPASLFVGNLGGYWRIHPDNAYTDTAGLNNATVGQEVARVNDLSGNLNHATQSTVSLRPTLQQDASGKYYLECGGTAARYLQFTTADNLSQPFTYCGGYRIRQLIAMNNDLFREDSYSYSVSYTDSTDSNRVKIFGGAVLGTTTSADTTAHVRTDLFNGASSYLRQDGAQLLVGSAGTLALWVSGKTFFLGRGHVNADRPYNNIYTTILINKALDPTERGDLEAFIATETGVTLP